MDLSLLPEKERACGTLQPHPPKQFVDYHEDLLFDDLAEFNQCLADWLLAYNTVLLHHSLGRQSLLQLLLQQQPECQGGGDPYSK